MKIGSLDLGHKMLVAPMAEITDSAFRIISKKYGAGLTFTQMVSAKGVLHNNFETLRLFSFPRKEKPIGVQLLGNEADYLKGAINELKNFDPDVIDFNCGCPVDKVTKCNMGASLLDDPKFLGSLISAMVKEAGKIAVSVKLRLGKDPKNINIIDNALAARDNGASFITIHARTKKDRYNEPPRLEWFEKVKKAVDIPIVANGSAFSPSDAKNLITEYGADSVMIARGALGNPFIFKRFNTLIENGFDPGDTPVSEIRDVAILHVELLIKEFGPAIGVNKAKKHILWYFMGQPGFDSLRDKIFACSNNEQLSELINSHTNKIESNEYTDFDKSKIEKLFNTKVQFWLEKEANII